MKTPFPPPIENGHGNMPKINLVSNDGSQAEVYLHGGQVTSWIPTGSDERLFLSTNSEFKLTKAIRGGVPVIFPQFGNLGPLAKHGFARTQQWELTSISGERETASATVSLQDNEATRSLWPHAFSCHLMVTVGGNQLTIKLAVRNTGEKRFEFTAALHTYLKVENISSTIIEGLRGLRYHDTVDRPSPKDWLEVIHHEPQLGFQGEIDRVYYNVVNPLTVCEPGKTTQVRNIGFPDVVIWNPGPEKAVKLSDLGEDGYQRMVCCEAAIAGTPVVLEPGDSWQGAQILIA